MKLIQKEIERWIKPYATIIGASLDVEEKLRKTNPLKYFLRVTIPNNFESYAIALHSFWVNNKISALELNEIIDEDEELPEDDFERVKWKDFFELKQAKFELESAYKSSSEFYSQFKSMNNELYPGEGLMDKEHINSLIKTVLKLYGNQEIELFYIFLATTDWEKDRIYQGKISELHELLDNKELSLTPSLIYPKEKNWVINTDYDLSFSFIGGEKGLIKELVSKNQDEIYELKY
jgi:hypothetical protein